MARQGTMHQLKVWRLLVITLVCAALGWVVTLLTHRAGWPSLSLPLSSLISLAVVIVVVLALGLRVYLWQRGTIKGRINPILAARTLILAQACAYAGAVLLGWHLGVGLDGVLALGLGARLSELVAPAGITVGSLVMVGVGFLVQKFCTLPPQDGGGEDLGTPDIDEGVRS